MEKWRKGKDGGTGRRGMGGFSGIKSIGRTGSDTVSKTPCMSS